MSAEPEPAHSRRFSHEAFLYAGPAEFAAGIRAFLGPAGPGDPVLALLPAPQAAALAGALGAPAGQVTFADVTEEAGNPARILGVWRRFAGRHPGTQLWGICEAVYPGRSTAEITECELSEALLNIAFDAATPLRLLCPYSLAALPAGVIAQAERTHPFLVQAGRRQPSGRFQPLSVAEPFARPLPAAPAGAACVPFGRGELGRLRAFVTEQARRAGLGQPKATSLVAAINEIATNSLQHGGGHGELRVWADRDWLVCEVSDSGHLTAPLAGRLPPATNDGAGLWLANQLTDLVQICSVPGATQIRVHQKRGH
jgi:anti-sigma regulatory factor (Ser/Thr protein kinase)